MEGIVNRLIMFVVLALVQVLVLNYVWLFNLATPLLYVFFVVTFPRNSAKGEVLVWCFMLGLVIDLFSNTPGLASGSMTLIALVQPYLLELFVPRDSAENMEVSVAAGYLWGRRHHYHGEFNDEHLIWKYDADMRYIGPTKLKLSLVWLLGKDGNKRKEAVHE